MPVNILLADDHLIITDALAAMIRESRPEANILQAKDLDTALDHLRHTEVQLAVCDINMPGANNFQMVRTIKTLQPDIRLMILSAYRETLYAHRYLKEGADAYLHKNTETGKIRDTILSLLHDGSAGIKTATPEVLEEESTPLSQLSNRELEVAQLLIQGFGILEISNLLNVHVNTVSTYKSRIFEKMNILSVPELIALFRSYADWSIS